MKGISFTTVFGLLLGFLLIGVSAVLTAKSSIVYVNVPGFIIVIGGTICATIASYPMKDIIKILQDLKIVFFKETIDTHRDIQELITISILWFKGDIRSIEDEMESVSNSFLKTGIQLIIDGSPLEDTLDLLNWRIYRLNEIESCQADIFKTMANYAPGFGMLGTLMGLVNMMQHMGDKNFATVGLNMSVALITTFYGIILANLLFTPIATKLQRRTQKRVALMMMILEGIKLLSHKRGPSFIRETMNSFIANFPDELSTEKRNQLIKEIAMAEEDAAADELVEKEKSAEHDESSEQDKIADKDEQ